MHSSSFFLKKISKFSIITINYISAIIDFYGTIQPDKITLDLKDPIYADVIGEMLNLKPRGAKIEILDLKKFYGEYYPYQKYHIYHAYCMRNFLFPIPKGKLTAGYIACLIDYCGVFYLNKKNDRYYAVLKIMKGNCPEIMGEYYQKKVGDAFFIQGQELLFALDSMKDHFILKKKEVDLAMHCLADPKNPWTFEQWEKMKSQL